ncbi:STAS domain-containing protein [Nocardia sp. NPDC049149]|uniref:STAS domain-containing protein n=1 Tax=Nocardia sp. NPDC049149 TaxID=3364315 RepID=UPI003716D4AD
MASNNDGQIAAAAPGRSVTRVPGMLRFSVCRPRRHIAMMRVDGEIDLWTAPSFRDQVSRVLGARSSVVVLDLSPVTFLAAAGLQVLVDAQAQAETTRRRMVLITKDRCVDRAIEVTGLAPSFHRVRSLNAVLAESVPGFAEGAGYEETA